MDQSVERALPSVRMLPHEAGVYGLRVTGNLDERAVDKLFGTRPHTRVP